MFFRYLWKHKIPNKEVISSFLKRPLSWPGVLLYVFFIAIAVTLYIGIIQFNNQFVTTAPARGGTATEGVIGAPRLINPVLANTETDIGLTRLLFSGLMKETNEGAIEPDLAEKVEVSEDGYTYTFTLRDHLKWSDGKALTSDDVLFTINKRALFEPNSYWQQVSVRNPDPQTVVFILPTPQSDFLSKATLGIIPMHIWSNVEDTAFEEDSRNLNPVGSGPFSLVRLHQEQGVVREIVLKRNRHYALTKSYLDRYRIVFFANQQELANALVDGDIMITGAALPETAHVFEETYTIDRVPSTSSIALFQNKNATLFSEATAEILNQSIDKRHILDTIEYGYGILPDTASLSLEESHAALQHLGFTTTAEGTLEKNGTPIGFSAAVENDPSTLAAAQAFAQALENIGITVVLKAFDPGTFQDIIQHTEYQFLFGKMKQEEIPTSYSPIITLYRLTYPLVHTPKLHIPISATLEHPLDRYRESNEWYVRTNTVWNIFAK